MAEDKKRKSSSEDKERKHKKLKKEKKEKKQKSEKDLKSTSDKQKQKRQQQQQQRKPSISVQSATAQSPDSAFTEVVAKIYLHLAPMWAANPMEGVTDQLNAFLMKYVPQVEGIILAHSDVELLSDRAVILYDSPFCHFFIRVKFLVWKPVKGSKLVGRINLQSQDHIGMLIYGTFNASIPKAHIPSDQYEWRVSEEEAKPFVDQDGQETEKRKRSQYGEWVNKKTGDAVGGKNGIVEFNVVDIVEANDILTVTGAL